MAVARDYNPRFSLKPQMITPDGIQDMASAIAKANGISLETATRYANLIGDTPELDGQNRVIVRDEQDREIARVIVPMQHSAASISA
jgi:hypothetical protein